MLLFLLCTGIRRTCQRVEDTQVKSAENYVFAHGTMEEKERMTERERVGDSKASCVTRTHTGTLSCLQLPRPQSFNKLPAGILKLGEVLALKCKVYSMCTHTHTRKHLQERSLCN